MTNWADKSYRVSENDFILPNGKKVEFPFPIRSVLEYGEYFVLMLKVSPPKVFNENVFGVSKEGKIEWQIKERKHVYSSSPYMSISKSDENVHLSNWDGLDLIVNSKSGEVISEKWSK